MLSVAEQLHIIKSRIADLVPEADLAKKLAEGRPLTVKLGVDPTAPDLHLGHAVVLRKLREFQDLGHQVLLIIGDFTALIGDPSGRNSTRPPLSLEQIGHNATTYIEQAFKILDRDRTTMRRNSEWLGELDFEGVLRLTSYFTVARILERDDFAERYQAQQTISLHEFLYPMAQAYDSVAIEADIEIGGTDQLFNLLAGRELMEKMGMEPQVCLTMPLLEGTDGSQKMSKSYGNYVGVTDPAEEMFGKVMSIPDELMVKYYQLCTGLPADDIEAIELRLSTGEVHPNATKRQLAREIVALYHSTGDALDAEAAFDRVFKEHKVPEYVPEFIAPLPDVVFLPALLKDAGLVGTNSDGRRMIDQGGVRIDGEVVSAGTFEVAATVLDGAVVQVGKRRFVRIVGR